MPKFKLALEDLQIDSFSTTPVKRAKGTVYGEQCTCPTACTCPGCPTCDASCNGTCGGTCDASCNGTCGDSCNCGTVYDASCNSCYYGCYTYQTRGPEGPCNLCGDL
ncbi:MAG TPA: hypothetical protein VFJ16_29720 [Longimicrobium sp.]|nr:hypothetical protein [Longimicrobium sp.]